MRNAFPLLMLLLATASAEWICLIKNGRIQDSALPNLLVQGIVVKSLQHYTSSSMITVDSTTQNPLEEQALVRLVKASCSKHRNDADILVARNSKIRLSSSSSSSAWDLDRIDQRSLPLDQSFTLGNGVDGRGVTIYSVDTGILVGDPEFGGRASTLYSAFSSTVDDNGHGSATAALAMGVTYGAAKQARLVALKVLDHTGHGDVAGVVAGFQHVLDHLTLPAVMVLSWQLTEGYYNTVLNATIQQLVDRNVTVYASAGNNKKDGCETYPAAFNNVVSVGGTDENDRLSSFSNYGLCVDLYAPATNVTSLHGTRYSGTSFAAPRVAAIAATVLQQNPKLSSDELVTILTRDATVNAIKNLPSGSYNRLLYARPRAFGGSRLDTLQPSASLAFFLSPSPFCVVVFFFFLFFFFSSSATATGVLM